MSKDQVESIDKAIAKDKAQIERGKALDRLRLNKDFQTIVEQGYFKDEAVRLVSALADAGMQRPEQQTSIRRQMDGVSFFQDYLHTVDTIRRMAEGNLDANESYREELLAGDVE